MLEPTPLYGGNADFLDALYEQFLREPASVGEQWQRYFERLAPAGTGRAHGPIPADIARRAAAAPTAPGAAPAANAREAAASPPIPGGDKPGPLTAARGPVPAT